MFWKESVSRGTGSPQVVGFHEPDTGSCQYLVWDPETRRAALIDVVQEFDPRSASTRHDAAAWALDQIGQRGLSLEWILDTHPHADHLMASSWLKQRTGVPNAIGEKVRDIDQRCGKGSTTPPAPLIPMPISTGCWRTATASCWVRSRSG